MGYTDKQIRRIKELRDAGLEWEDVADKYNEEYPEDHKSANAIRKTYNRYKYDDIDDDTIIKNLKSVRQYAQTNQQLRKENKHILDNIITVEKFLEEFTNIFKKCGVTKYSPPKIKKDKKNPKLVIEAMISDTHIGIKTKTYDYDVTRKRVQKFINVFLDEVEFNKKFYDIDYLQILSLGDIIQSATMHRDSGNSCHLTNAEQLAAAIECLFYDAVLPIALMGHNVKFLGLCGNHDREDSDNFTSNPGTTYYTYTIYKALEMLCEQSGLNNVKFEIPNDPYLVYEVFGSNFLAEHGYLIKKKSIDALESMLVKRSSQVGKILDGIRSAHFHEDLVGSKGRYIINGSTVSDDHFGNGLGYKSRPCQVINYYVENKEGTSYHHSLPVNLE